MLLVHPQRNPTRSSFATLLCWPGFLYLLTFTTKSLTPYANVFWETDFPGSVGARAESAILLKLNGD